MAINGAAIYGSRPWERAEGSTRDGREVRFTLGDDGAVYAIVLGEAVPGELVIPGLPGDLAGNVTLLGHEGVLECRYEGSELRIRLSDNLPAGPAHTFRLGG